MNKPLELKVAGTYKKSYIQGEAFNPAGLTVSAIFPDGTVKENVEYSITPTGPLHPNDTSVTVEYCGVQAELKIKVRWLGNQRRYCVFNTLIDPNSALKGKTYFFLGSSVTVGSGSTHDSMADYIAKRNGCTVIKNAVSGTTLADTDKRSYVRRLDKYIEDGKKATHLDAFICQLSTNDSNIPELFGVVAANDIKNKSAFDKATTLGAIEYIIASVKENWDCPILFYTNCYFEKPQYEKMVEALKQIAVKWDIKIIDLYCDTRFNDISAAERELYMHDDIHPTKAGYRDWWTPKFETALKELISV